MVQFNLMQTFLNIENIIIILLFIIDLVINTYSTKKNMVLQTRNFQNQTIRYNYYTYNIE